MKNHRFLWLRNRTTDNRKCEKARNIKEKRTIEMFSTASKKREEQASSQSVNKSSPRDSLSTFTKIQNPCDCKGFSFVEIKEKRWNLIYLQCTCNKLATN